MVQQKSQLRRIGYTVCSRAYNTLNQRKTVVALVVPEDMADQSLISLLGLHKAGRLIPCDTGGLAAEDDVDTDQDSGQDERDVVTLFTPERVAVMEVHWHADGLEDMTL